MIIRKLGMFVWGTIVLASGGLIPVLAEAQQSIDDLRAGRIMGRVVLRPNAMK